MARLPHFKNSTAGRNKWEPVYKNLFTLTFDFGELPFSANAKGISNDLFIEHVKSISGLNVEKLPPVVEQKYQFATRRYAGAVPDTTALDLTINFTVNLNDQNQMYIYNKLREWSDLCFNPLTGAYKLKKQYAASYLKIEVFNKAGDVFRSLTCYNVFPMQPISPLELDYTSNELYEMTLVLSADYYDENRL